jgi:hypothetical protein
MRMKFEMMQTWRVSAWPLLAAAWVAVACAQPRTGPTAAPEAAVPGTPAAMAQIEALIGEAPCRVDNDCRVIGVGATACGGPDAYRAWSVMYTDGPLLETLVARDAAARRQEMERRGIASTCAILPVPGVACAAPASPSAMGRCVLLPSAAGLK